MYERNCPLCDSIITHKNKYNRNQLDKVKKPCRKCSIKIRSQKYDYSHNFDCHNKNVKLGIVKNGFNGIVDLSKLIELVNNDLVKLNVTFNL